MMWFFSSSLLLLAQNLIPKEYTALLSDLPTKQMLSSIQADPIKVPKSISNDSVLSTYGLFTTTNGVNINSINEKSGSRLSSLSSSSSNGFFKNLFPKATKPPPFVLLHGFDSSCLEFRKLAPLLALETQREVYVPDILGWGFSDQSNVTSFTPEAKVTHLKCFINQVIKQPVILVGASLGGAVAIQLTAENPTLVDRLVLIDAQGFLEGVKSDIPDVFSKLGIQVLKSWPLRSYAGTLSYYNKKFCTDLATKIGRLHCLTASWEKASLNFLKSGGFQVASLIPRIQQKSLILWGENDEILNLQTAYQFQKTLSKNQLIILEECGHVPHLEKPIETVEAIKSFLKNF